MRPASPLSTILKRHWQRAARAFVYTLANKLQVTLGVHLTNFIVPSNVPVKPPKKPLLEGDGAGKMTL